MNDSSILGEFIQYLRENDFAENTVSGYQFDLKKFFEWYLQSLGEQVQLKKLSPLDLINYRQFLLNVRGLQPTTINRRLEALRKLSRWAVQTKRMKSDVAISLKPIKFVRNRQPLGLLENEVHALLRVAGSSNFAVRNYAIVQLIVQTGLRVSEVADLKMSDVKASERAGTVLVRQGKGLKEGKFPQLGEKSHRNSSPQSFKPVSRCPRVANCMRDVFMSQVILNQSRIISFVCQTIPG
jgi:site-specific recombinase XerD